MILFNLKLFFSLFSFRYGEKTNVCGNNCDVCEDTVRTGKELLAQANVDVTGTSEDEAAFEHALIAAAVRVEKEYLHTKDMTKLSEDLLNQSTILSPPVSNVIGEDKGADTCEALSSYSSSTTSSTQDTETQHARETGRLLREDVTNVMNKSSSVLEGEDMTGVMNCHNNNTTGRSAVEKEAAATLSTAHTASQTATSILSRSKDRSLAVNEEVKGGALTILSKRKRITEDDEVEDDAEHDEDVVEQQLFSHSEEMSRKTQTETRRLLNFNNQDAHSVREAMQEIKSRCPFCFSATCSKYCAAACSAIYDAVDKDPVVNRRGAHFWCRTCSLTQTEEKSGAFCKELDKKVGPKPLGL